MNKNLLAHILAAFTILIWSATFICTKVLLDYLNPFSILFYRFLLAYIVLLIVYPKYRNKFILKDEILYFFAGLTGVTLYLLLENTAVDYSTASNVGLIVSSAPIFTALAFSFFYKDEKIGKNFFMGFFIAFAGIFIVMFSGQKTFKINPLGDFLALFSAISWGGYSVLYRKISSKNINIILITRKIFFYALLTMIPLSFVFNISTDFAIFTNKTVIFNLIFLGGLASAVCYATWAYSCVTLGTIKTSVYIYLIPLLSLVISRVILNEKITLLKIVGCLFILSGVYISEKKQNAQSADIAVC